MEYRGAGAGGNELADFQRARRAALDPAVAGLVDDGRARRVPGLRREELAQLAHVSVDYVVRLEQCRTRRVSRAILDALADALRLAADERAYLLAVAEQAGHAPARRSAARQVDPRDGPPCGRVDDALAGEPGQVDSEQRRIPSITIWAARSRCASSR